MSELPEAIQAELRRIARLPRNALGPIPETYETLHGITFLKEIYRTIRSGRKLEDALQSLPFCCLALTILNASALLRDAADALTVSQEPDISGAAAKLDWCDSILGIATEIAHVAALLPNASARKRTVGPIPWLDAMRSAFSTVGAALVHLEDRQAGFVGEAVGSGYLEDPGARLVHLFKNVAAQIALLETARIAVDVPGAEDILTLAEINATALTIDRDTYADQFALLHQVPELIAFLSIELVDAAIANMAKRRYSAAEQCIRIVNALFPCINLCLRPLVDLMYPSEYYKFRENLGATSGSHSKDFGALLLSRKYEELAATYRDGITGRPGRQGARFKALTWQIFELRQNLYRWRDTHINLPRNVLGSGATSLVGTKNATSSVERMRGSFVRRDMLAEPGSPGGAGADGGKDLAGAGRQAEARLLAITGDIARGTFPDVEGRTGPVFGRRQAE